ncbi:hypothetical protein CEXT_143531 [Caerostris extrusa]|uniref:Uncharacterized protein n=1 Tax=Caerostris extrusa TaxID=172846 RepID=A0AAV4QJG5_CAEEX|nr:hypothetical protein CEXT_143531 [Caerostris extrusa]
MQMKAELDRRFIDVVAVQDTGVEGYQLGSRFVAGRTREDYNDGGFIRRASWRNCLRAQVRISSYANEGGTRSPIYSRHRSARHRCGRVSIGLEICCRKARDVYQVGYQAGWFLPDIKEEENNEIPTDAVSAIVRFKFAVTMNSPIRLRY